MQDYPIPHNPNPNRLIPLLAGYPIANNPNLKNFSATKKQNLYRINHDFLDPFQVAA